QVVAEVAGVGIHRARAQPPPGAQLVEERLDRPAQGRGDRGRCARATTVPDGGDRRAHAASPRPWACRGGSPPAGASGPAPAPEGAPTRSPRSASATRTARPSDTRARAAISSGVAALSAATEPYALSS